MNDQTHENDNARDRIERCAIQLFATRGYARTSVREVVEAAGVTKPTLYYHFGSKDQLYLRIIHDAFDTFYEGASELVQTDGSLAEQLEGIARLHFDHISADRLRARLIFQAVHSVDPEAPRPDMESHMMRSRGLLLSALQAAVARGEIPPEAASEFMVTELWGMVQIYLSRLVLGYEDRLDGDLAKRIVRLFLDGARRDIGAAEAVPDNHEAYSGKVQS